MSTKPEYREASAIDLVRELRRETVLLLQQEAALVRQEFSEKITTTTRNSSYLAAGCVVAYSGILFLFLAAMRWLDVKLPAWGLNPVVAHWIAPLLVGFLVTLIGYLLVSKAMQTFRRESVVPRKTLDSLRRDRDWAKRKMS